MLTESDLNTQGKESGFHEANNEKPLKFSLFVLIKSVFWEYTSARNVTEDLGRGEVGKERNYETMK